MPVDPIDLPTEDDDEDVGLDPDDSVFDDFGRALRELNEAGE